MLPTLALTLAATCALGSVLPRSERLPMYDGYPSPNADQLHQIEVDAGGNIPNSHIPGSLSQASHSSIQLLSFIEAMGAAFYDQLEYNLTTSQPGYTSSDIPTGQNASTVAKYINSFRAIQEIHALSARAVGNASGVPDFPGCPEYVFPVTNLTNAVDFAIVMQNAAVGTVGDAAQALVNNGDIALIRALMGIVSAEGAVTGYLNDLYSQITGIPVPNVPFTTSLSRQYFLSYFIRAIPDPSACPGLDSLTKAFPPFPPMAVESLPEPSNQDGTFTLLVPAAEYQWNATYYGVIMNQLTSPVVQNITNVKNVTDNARGDVVSFDLGFPYQESLLNGLVAIALTTSAGPFDDVDGVTNATAFGPLLLFNNE